MQWQGRNDAGIDAWTTMSGALDSPYTWLTRPLSGNECAPVAWTRGRSTYTVTSFNAGPINPTVFTPSPSCKRTPSFAGCHAAHLKARFEAGELVW